MSKNIKTKQFFLNHVSRILAIQYVYQFLFILGSKIDEKYFYPFEVQSILIETSIDNDSLLSEYNKDLYISIVDNFQNIIFKLNEVVSEVAHERPIEQIDYVTRSIWYVIATEVELLQNIPPKVGIDEAIELDKELNAGRMYSLTNVVLGKYFNL